MKSFQRSGINIIKLLSVISLFISQAYGDYSYGGSCLSQGKWTKSALQFSQEIKSTLQRFRDDPNCKGLEDIYSEVKISDDLMSDDSIESDKVKSDLSSLDALIRSGEGSSKGASALLGKIIDDAGGNKKTQDGRARAVNTGIKTLGAFFDKLPNYDSCLVGHPGLVGPILSNSVKVLASYSGANGANTNALGETLNKFLNMIREKKFTSSISLLDDSELTNTISCLIESTTENYCRVKDAYEVLELAQSVGELEDETGTLSEYNPLEGYFILTRETKVLSSWLQDVMFGVTPRTIADSNQKNKVISNVNEFLQDENSLYGYYSIQAIEYEALINEESRKNHLLEMVKELTNYMIGANNYSTRQGTGDANFFKRSMLADKIPFFLIGINEIPSQISSNDTGSFVMDKWVYMEQGGKFLPEFDKPDLLLERIGENLKEIVILAKENASSYFQKRLIVDKQNLVDEAIVSQQISPYRSFTRIERYLTKLISRAKKSTKREFYGMVPSLMETRESIQKIVTLFDKYFTDSEQILRDSSSVEDSKKKRKTLSKMAMSIIATVYVEFNIILQRDTFIMNRILTYVKYDYMFFTKQNEDLTSYQKDLLIIAGKQLIELLGSSYDGNPAKVRLDLASAQVINRVNMNALEEIFRDSMFNTIAKYRRIEQGKGDGFGAFFVGFEKRLYQDSLSENFQQEQILVTLRDEYPGELKDLAIEELNISLFSFNPFKWVYRSVMNSDRYAYVGRIFERANYNVDDEYGSLSQVKAKLCSQTLAFSNFDEYFYLCKGSKVKGIKSSTDKDLDLNYNKIILPYIKGVYTENTKEIKESYDKNVCALRDFRRRNHAHWLLKDFTKLGND
jgi:hypothetical protein